MEAVRICDTGEHQWDGCKCVRCGATRDEGHSWVRCRCQTCGKTREVDIHVWRAPVFNGSTYTMSCHICGKTVYPARTKEQLIDALTTSKDDEYKAFMIRHSRLNSPEIQAILEKIGLDKGVSVGLRLAAIERIASPEVLKEIALTNDQASAVYLEEYHDFVPFPVSVTAVQQIRNQKVLANIVSTPWNGNITIHRAQCSAIRTLTDRGILKKLLDDERLGIDAKERLKVLRQK